MHTVLKSILVLAFLGSALLSGCSVSPQPLRFTTQDSPRYLIDVFPSRPPVVSRDGFDAGLTFFVTAERPLRQDYLVQELHQTMIYEYTNGTESKDSFSLVECFRLRQSDHTALGVRYELEHGQFDRHFHRGLTQLSAEVKAVRVERTILAYVADVEGADFTRRGFAQLERNESGDVVTNSPGHFNAGYREKHETRGQPLRTNHAGGVTYQINYRLIRVGLGKADFEITHAKGNGRVYQPSLVLRQ